MHRVVKPNEFMDSTWLADLKLLSIGWIVALAIGCASTRHPSHSFAVNSTERAIHMVLDEVFAAAAQKDFTRLDHYHLYDAKFTKFSGERAARLDAEASREDEHRSLMAVEGLATQRVDEKIDVFGKIGIATFILQYQFHVSTNSVTKNARGTLVLVYDQGTWKIVHEHFSPVLATP